MTGPELARTGPAATTLTRFGVVVLTQGKRPEDLTRALDSLLAQEDVTCDIVVVGNAAICVVDIAPICAELIAANCVEVRPAIFVELRSPICVVLKAANCVSASAAVAVTVRFWN